jgi:hypothetical protein
MCRHIFVGAKKVYLVPFQEVDALKAKKGGAATTWAVCDARSLSAIDLEVLGKKLSVPNTTQLRAAIAMADTFHEQLGFTNHGIICCDLGFERTSTVAALVLRKHDGKTTLQAMTTIQTAYQDVPAFRNKYESRPLTHLQAYDKFPQ